MPMSVEEMKAHGYLGIPGPQEATPGARTTAGVPAAEAAAGGGESDQVADATEQPEAGPDASVDVGPSVPERLINP
jgi:hypothetical protein